MVQFATAFHVHAQAGGLEYTLLEPIGDLKAGQKVGFTPYMETLYKWTFRGAVVVGVVMLVYAGFIRTFSGALGYVSESKINEAKGINSRVAAGLAWLFGSYLILSIINPNAANVRLNIENLGAPASGTTQGISQNLGGQYYPEGDRGEAVNIQYNANQKGFGTEKEVKDYIAAVGKGNVIWNRNTFCEKPGQTGCTSLANLPQNAIDGIVKLSSSCNCKVQINAGTDCVVDSSGNCSDSGSSMHKEHGAGIPVVDLDDSPALNDYIYQAGNYIGKNSSGYSQYLLNGNTYVQETDHWHVKYK